MHLLCRHVRPILIAQDLSGRTQFCQILTAIWDESLEDYKDLLIKIWLSTSLRKPTWRVNQTNEFA